MIFHNTEIDSYLRCQRQAVLSSSNGQHLAPIFSPLSLQVGTIVHRGHYKWLKDTDNTADLEFHTMTAAVEEQDKLIKSYKATVGTEPSDDDMATLFESISFCRDMAKNYEIVYGKKLPDGYKLIAAEQKVRVRVPGTKHYLAGSLDAFIEDLETGDLGILERKTYKARTQLRTLRRIPQFRRYSWMVSQLGLSRTGKPPFVLYDGLWRRHVPPKGKRMDDLFNRHRITPTQAQLDELARFLPKTLNEMAFLYEHPELARPTVPFKGCGDCAFDREGQELCDAMTSGQPELIKYYRDNKFVERTDDTEAEETDSDTE